MQAVFHPAARSLIWDNILKQKQPVHKESEVMSILWSKQLVESLQNP